MFARAGAPGKCFAIALLLRASHASLPVSACFLLVNILCGRGQGSLPLCLLVAPLTVHATHRLYRVSSAQLPFLRPPLVLGETHSEDAFWVNSMLELVVSKRPSCCAVSGPSRTLQKAPWLFNELGIIKLPFSQLVPQ